MKTIRPWIKVATGQQPPPPLSCLRDLSYATQTPMATVLDRKFRPLIPNIVPTVPRVNPLLAILPADLAP